MAFINHRLTLSDEINLQFAVLNLDYNDHPYDYVSFEVSDGRTGTMYFSDAVEDNFNLQVRWFTCGLNALELADTVTATYHYGDGETVSNTYSVMEYFSYMRTAYSNNEDIINLIDATQNYGYYMQLSGWTDGRQHEPIPETGIVLDDDNISEAREMTSDSAIVKNNLENAGIDNVKYALTLNSKTVINLFVNPAEGVTINSVSDNVTAKGTRKFGDDTYYRYDTDGISPGNLGFHKQITIATSADTASVNVTPMSYVHEVVKEGSTFTQEKQLAMAAYYEYYTAVLNI